MMFGRAPQESSLVFDDQYLSQLSKRIGDLRELIIVMVEQDRDTRLQSELLFEMLRTSKAAKGLRKHALACREPQADPADPADAANQDEDDRIPADVRCFHVNA